MFRRRILLGIKGSACYLLMQVGCLSTQLQLVIQDPPAVFDEAALPQAGALVGSDVVGTLGSGG